MLRIRLTRKGKKNNAFYRIVVAEARRPIKGKFIEILGWLNPHSKELKLEKERILYWISKGAQPSDTVNNLLIKQGIIKGNKANKFKVKKKKGEEDKEASPKPKEEQPIKEEAIAKTNAEADAKAE